MEVSIETFIWFGTFSEVSAQFNARCSCSETFVTLCNGVIARSFSNVELITI